MSKTAAYRYLEVREDPERFTVHFLEPVLGESLAGKVAAELELVADRTDNRPLWISFSGVTCLCSWMLGKLIALDRKMKRQNRSLVLCEISPTVRDVLSRTRLDTLFELAEEVPVSSR